MNQFPPFKTQKKNFYGEAYGRLAIPFPLKENIGTLIPFHI
jgi:hypothetical protein